jgi:hypothetical protein
VKNIKDGVQLLKWDITYISLIRNQREEVSPFDETVLLINAKIFWPLLKLLKACFNCVETIGYYFIIILFPSDLAQLKGS